MQPSARTSVGGRLQPRHTRRPDWWITPAAITLVRLPLRRRSSHAACGERAAPPGRKHARRHSPWSLAACGRGRSSASARLCLLGRDRAAKDGRRSLLESSSSGSLVSAGSPSAGAAQEQPSRGIGTSASACKTSSVAAADCRERDFLSAQSRCATRSVQGSRLSRKPGKRAQQCRETPIGVLDRPLEWRRRWSVGVCAANDDLRERRRGRLSRRCSTAACGEPR